MWGSDGVGSHQLKIGLSYYHTDARTPLQMETDSPEAGEKGSDDSSLTARLRIVLHEEANCAVLDAGTSGEQIKRNLISTNGNDDQKLECRAEVTLSDGTSKTKRFVSSSIEDHCICPIFRINDCVVEFQSFRNRAMSIAITAPSRAVVRTVIDDIRSCGATVTLESILPLEYRSDEDRTIELDASRVTDKQCEAITTAIEAGYYDTPRRSNLAELAEHLGVSQSAVSQRLNSAESTLIQELYSSSAEYRP